MTALIQFLKGYLTICVSGFSPERFMNLCSNNGILLWNIKKEDGKYEMCIFLKAFYQLRPIARKTGTKVVIRKRIGLPFFVPRLKKRKTFIFGLLLTIIIAVISSEFIWKIEFRGNYQISDDLLQTYLNEQKVNIGSYKKRVDIVELEKSIRKNFTQFTWVCVKFSGTKLLVEVKENDMTQYPPKTEMESGYDLVSESPGKIVSMIVRSGVPKVKIGETISESTVLIEGKVPVFNEDGTVREYKYVDADGDIYLEHTIWYDDVLKRRYQKKKYTGREHKKYYIRFKNNTYGLLNKNKYIGSENLIREITPDLFEKLGIPFYFGTVTEREYQIYDTKYTEDEAKEILAKNLLLFLESLNEKGVQIIEKNVKIEENEITMRFLGEITVWEKVEMKLPTQKSPEA